MNTDKRFGECSREEKIQRLNECGLNHEGPLTWTEENCKSFEEKNPGYVADFEEKHTITHCGYGGCESRVDKEKTRLLVLEADKYRKEINYGYSDVGYSGLRLRRCLGDEVILEQPFNVSSLWQTFSESDAKRIVLQDWDLTDCKNVGALFCGNHHVEEIDMRCWFPVNEVAGYLDKTNFSSMFEDCVNLRRLWLNTGPRNSYFMEEGYILGIELRDCFKGCKNLEYVFFGDGPYSDLYIQKIVEASEKTVTIDGRFCFDDWVKYHGGLRLKYDLIIGLGTKVELAHEPGTTDFNFVGQLFESSIDDQEELADLFMARGMITEEDHATYKKYLQELRNNPAATGKGVK